jgi:hypothetical protein
MPWHPIGIWSRPKPSHTRYQELKSYWWLGTDEMGRRWVLKMTGSNYAYREHVFASLAQRLGISCQSSMYLTIPRGSAPILHETKTEPHQLALCFLEEHLGSCSLESCPLDILNDLSIDSEENLQIYLSCGVKNTTDFIRGEILGYLCGQFEPPDRLFTMNHELVQIDNELMFANDPINLVECRWLQFRVGLQCAEDICCTLSELSEDEILAFAEIPSGYLVTQDNNIPRKLLAAHRAAKNYLTRKRIPRNRILH